MAPRNNFKSGSCEMIILFLLKKYGDCYAYQLSQLIKKTSDNTISFPEGSLYPAFYRLLENNLISDYRKKSGKRMVKIFYHLEPAGEKRLEELLEEYKSTINAIDMILNYDFCTESDISIEEI